jgi:hypothetical protein
VTAAAERSAAAGSGGFHSGRRERAPSFFKVSTLKGNPKVSTMYRVRLSAAFTAPVRASDVRPQQRYSAPGLNPAHIGRVGVRPAGSQGRGEMPLPRGADVHATARVGDAEGEGTVTPQSTSSERTERMAAELDARPDIHSLGGCGAECHCNDACSSIPCEFGWEITRLHP